MNLILIIAAATAADAAAVLPMPAFLAGCWENRAGQRWTEECWTSERGGLMIGSGRSGEADSVKEWEWMRIERAADGEIIFYGSPKGARPVAFRATDAGADRITFLNTTHDFPQRVSYARTATGIEAKISLSDGSKPIRWNYGRQGASKPGE